MHTHAVRIHCMKNSGQIRIIGGQWRRRILRFPRAATLRPTPDSVRETLFNWLRNDISGSNCLDLYAGSGALGFEAASRGADRVCMVDINRSAIESMQNNCQALGATQVDIVQDHALHFLDYCHEQYDVIFIDPPYRSDELFRCLEKLRDSLILKKNTLLYLEIDTANPLSIEPRWHIIRQTNCGQVLSYLIQT